MNDTVGGLPRRRERNVRIEEEQKVQGLPWRDWLSNFIGGGCQYNGVLRRTKRN